MKPTTHPQYDERLPQWTKVSDCFDGSDTIKGKGDEYLRPTGGMIAEGYGGASTATATTIGLRGMTTMTLGDAMYEAYVDRAVFHPYVFEAITGLVGVLHRKPPTVTVPKRLEPMLARMSNKGESLEQLWLRISEAQLKEGRCGLAVDLPTGVAGAVPVVALYKAACVLNWDTEVGPDGRDAVRLVLLDESGYEMNADLEYELVTRVRVLTTAARAKAMGADVAAEGDTYVTALFTGPEGETDLTLDPNGWVVPAITSTAEDSALGVIPFVFVNPNDLVPQPDQPPLNGLADLTLAIYRGEADHRHTLYMQSQETLVKIGDIEPTQGGDRPIKVGAGAVINLPPGGEAYYIGVSAAGLGAQKEAIDADKAQAAAYAVQMIDTKGSDAESGEALRVRVSARTASAARLQRTAAQAIHDALVHAAMYLGLSDAEIAEITVEPNLDFADETSDGNDVAAVTGILASDGPLSPQSVHAYYVRKGITTMTFEDEMKAKADYRTEFGGPADGATDTTMEPEEDKPDADDGGGDADAR